MLVSWLDSTLEGLSRQPAIGYAPGGSVAGEATALAALALAAHGRVDAAQRAAGALEALQSPAGAVGILAGHDSPGWPTSLAVCAWCAVDRRAFRANIERGLAWLLGHRGEPVEQSPDFGHNTELVGWSYAEQTHSWVEPTALALLALRAAGQAAHPAAREAARLLLNRELPAGGFNYGNTVVLGQVLRPHVQPTGVALTALAAESLPPDRLARSAAWLRRAIGLRTPPLSLGWALLGLRAAGAAAHESEAWLAAAAQTTTAPYKLALLALAAKGWPA
jgi:hypothetical protein